MENDADNLLILKWRGQCGSLRFWDLVGDRMIADFRLTILDWGAHINCQEKFHVKVAKYKFQKAAKLLVSITAQGRICETSSLESLWHLLIFRLLAQKKIYEIFASQLVSILVWLMTNLKSKILNLKFHNSTHLDMHDSVKRKTFFSNVKV